MARTGAGFRWEAPPSRVSLRAGQYGDAVMAALGDLADLYAARMEAYAKANAPWTDQTGNARQGLTGASEKEPNQVAVILYGTAQYQPYLELGRSGRRPYPIIVPTIEAHAAEIMDSARQIVGDR